MVNVSVILMNRLKLYEISYNNRICVIFYIITYLFYQMGVNGLDRYKFGREQAVGIHFNSKEINAENVDSPAYEFAIAA